MVQAQELGLAAREPGLLTGNCIARGEGLSLRATAQWVQLDQQNCMSYQNVQHSTPGIDCTNRKIFILYPSLNFYTVMY